LKDVLWKKNFSGSYAKSLQCSQSKSVTAVYHS